MTYDEMRMADLIANLQMLKDQMHKASKPEHVVQISKWISRVESVIESHRRAMDEMTA